ncbi:MAG: filamentous hemagglutinin N-terminal domain-containing protein [Jaaginema sp. PMC 1079.18]|nr:filamentous hemagglutinin N-terminal domain-containing protein [Jaaginema sp. PMC 1079.18]
MNDDFVGLKRVGFAGIILSLFSSFPVQAQVTAAPDGTGTVVNFAGNTYTITGGTVAGNNQFHSFSQLDLPVANTADFVANNANIVNILGRITSNNPSIIDGLIRVSGGNNPNLYLMNPTGIIFGSNASLNVSGDFFATTATAIGFGSNNWFNSAGSNNYASLTGNPSQFAFDLATAGTIVNRGNLTVDPGNTVGLIGGTVANTGTLSGKEGAIAIASVPGTSLVQISQAGNILNLQVNPPRNAQGQVLPFTPLDLPALLTNSGGVTTGLVLNGNNTVQTQLGTLLSTAPGTAIITGNLDVSQNSFGAPGGQIAVVGNNAFLADNVSLTLDGIQSKGFSIRADENISIQNIATNVLDIPTGYTETILIADANGNGNGSFQMTAGNILRTDGALTITGATIAAGGLDTTNSTNVGQAFLNLTATQGNLNVAGDLRAYGNINLQALQGDITVQTIWTRGGDLNIKTNGLFRAEAANLAFPGLTYNAQNSPSYNPKLTQFLIQERGFDATAWANLQGDINIDVSSYPVSILVGDYNGLGGSIRIQHGGNSFETGAIDNGLSVANDPRAFIPSDPVTFAAFTPSSPGTILLTENRQYTTRNLSVNASGTVGGIIAIDASTNSRARQTLQDSVFASSINQAGSLGSFEIIFISPSNASVANNVSNNSNGNIALRGDISSPATGTIPTVPPPPREESVNSLEANLENCKLTTENTEDNPHLREYERQCQHILEQDLAVPNH